MLFTNLKENFGTRWLQWMSLFAILMLGVRVMGSDHRYGEKPPARTNAEGLIAPASDPYMFEAIRMAQMPVSTDGPWGGEKRKSGPTVTIQTPGAPIILTREELANANQIYPQLKANPKILYGQH